MEAGTRCRAVAGGLLSAFIAAGCTAHLSSETRASPAQRCTAVGVSASGRHQGVARSRAPCPRPGLAAVDAVAGGAGSDGARGGRSDAPPRRQAAAGDVRPADVVASPRRHVTWVMVRSAPQVRGSPAVNQNRALRLITLISWFVSVSSGGFMLGTWVARGGPGQQRARREGLPPGVIFSHFGLAFSGFVLWITYVATGLAAVAWTAAALLVPVVGLGISTLTLWTPYPTHGSASKSEPPRDPGAPRHAGSMLGTPAEDAITRRITDDELASALTDDGAARRLTEEVLASILLDPSAAGRKPKPKGHLAALVPALHGVAAVTTILFAMLTVVSTR